ncbi:MAG TPA: Hpt domain-containing protein [Chthonomonadales bacterium]|nr:Hpt domain-containing protein [Chthonomonadales bacterium]
MTLNRERLRQSAGDDPELERELGAEFANALPALMERFASAGREGALDRLRSAAHCLKGSSRTLGLERVAAACERIEADAATGAGDNSAALIVELRARCEEAAAALQAIVMERAP